MSMLKHALSYAARGWRLFPVRGKQPLIKDWPTLAATDAEQLRQWWTDLTGATGIGLATGAESGVFVLDADDLESLQAFEAEIPLPDTLVARTGSGGLHIYFRHPGFLVRNSASKLRPGLDIRGDGGFVVLPPSQHASGNTYEWLTDLPIAEAPEALLALIRARPSEPSISTGAGVPVDLSVARAWLKTHGPAIQGQGGDHHTFVACSQLLRNFALPEDQALELLTEWNTQCQPPWTDADLSSKLRNADSYASGAPILEELTDTTPPPGDITPSAPTRAANGMHVPPLDNKPVSPAERIMVLRAIERLQQAHSQDECFHFYRALQTGDPIVSVPEGACWEAVTSFPHLRPSAWLTRFPIDAQSELTSLYAEHGVASVFNSLDELANVQQVDQIVASRDAHVYAHGEELAEVRQGRICPLDPATLRTRLSHHMRILRHRTRTVSGVEQEDWTPGEYPPRIVEAYDAYKRWLVRPINGAFKYPVLLPDGRISPAGYDAASGIFHEPTIRVQVPDAPTAEDIKQAVATILEPYVDFPFVDEANRSAAIAGLLTLLARPAIQGPVPLFALDASMRGSGKTLLANVASLIAHGERFPVQSCPSSDEEMGKVITAIVRDGTPAILFDNVSMDQRLGSASLDAALTSTVWRGRRLGQTEILQFPLVQTFFVTGNQLSFARDTSRRVLVSRLAPIEERPEERTAFKHPHLLQWIKDNRKTLLGACLTLLRGYWQAGKPDQHIKQWGSFEEWQDVASCIVWAGLPDPTLTRVQVMANDEDANMLGILLSELMKAFPGGPEGSSKLFTSGDVDKARRGNEELLSVLCSSSHQTPFDLDTQHIGNVLRHAADQSLQGLRLKKHKTVHGKAHWTVEHVTLS